VEARIPRLPGIRKDAERDCRLIRETKERPGNSQEGRKCLTCYFCCDIRNLGIAVEITRKDILLLLLYVPGPNKQYNESIKGITKFTKLLYLLKKLHNIDKYVKKYYSFEAHKLGPFTREIYDDVDFFQSLGFIDKKIMGTIQESEYFEFGEFLEDFIPEIEIESISQDIYKETKFMLTTKGKKFAERLSNQVPDKIIEACKGVKTKFGFLPLSDLLRYIYLKYPEMAIKTIRKDLLRD